MRGFKAHYIQWMLVGSVYAQTQLNPGVLPLSEPLPPTQPSTGWVPERRFFKLMQEKKAAAERAKAAAELQAQAVQQPAPVSSLTDLPATSLEPQRPQSPFRIFVNGQEFAPRSGSPVPPKLGLGRYRLSTPREGNLAGVRFLDDPRNEIEVVIEELKEGAPLPKPEQQPTETTRTGRPSLGAQVSENLAAQKQTSSSSSSEVKTGPVDEQPPLEPAKKATSASTEESFAANEFSVDAPKVATKIPENSPPFAWEEPAPEKSNSHQAPSRTLEALAPPPAPVPQPKPRDATGLTLRQLAERFQLSDICQERLVRFFATHTLFEGADPGYAPEMKGLDSLYSFYQKNLVQLRADIREQKKHYQSLEQQYTSSSSTSARSQMKKDLQARSAQINSMVERYNRSRQVMQSPDSWYETIAAALQMACRRMAYNPREPDSFVDEGGVIAEIRSLAVFLEPNVGQMNLSPAERMRSQVFDEGMGQLWSIHQAFGNLGEAEKEARQDYARYSQTQENQQKLLQSLQKNTHDLQTHEALARGLSRKDPRRSEHERAEALLKNQIKSQEAEKREIERALQQHQERYSRSYWGTKKMCEEIVARLQGFVIGSGGAARYKPGYFSLLAFNDFYLDPLHRNAINLVHQLKAWGSSSQGLDLRLNLSKIRLGAESCEPTNRETFREIQRIVSEYSRVQDTYVALNEQALKVVSTIETQARAVFEQQTLKGEGLPPPETYLKAAP